MIEESPRSQAPVEQLQSVSAARVRALRTYLTDHPEVVVEDVETASAIINAGVELIVHQLAATTSPIADERIERELVDMLVRYLTCREAPQPD